MKRNYFKDFNSSIASDHFATFASESKRQNLTLTLDPDPPLVKRNYFKDFNSSIESDHFATFASESKRQDLTLLPEPPEPQASF